MVYVQGEIQDFSNFQKFLGTILDLPDISIFIEKTHSRLKHNQQTEERKAKVIDRSAGIQLATPDLTQ